MADKMTAMIEIDFVIDGECPSTEVLEKAIGKIIRNTQYIGSKEIDDSDDSWGLEILTTAVILANAESEASE